MSPRGPRRRLDWLQLLAATAAVVVVVLFVLAMLDAWVLSTPGDRLANAV
jgi:hypothetical protein